jgi:hypothetical protein
MAPAGLSQINATAEFTYMGFKVTMMDGTYKGCCDS